MTKTRLEAFTDAVIAIIMTILAIDLVPPATDTTIGFIDFLPDLAIYAISFIILSVYWINHHHLFQIINKINGKVLWANICFLLVLSLTPVMSKWLIAYPNSFIPEVFYSLFFMITNLSYIMLTVQLIKVNDQILTIKDSTLYKNLVSLCINILGITLGYYFSPIIILISFVIILVLWVIPSKNIEKHIGEGDNDKNLL